ATVERDEPPGRSSLAATVSACGAAPDYSAASAEAEEQDLSHRDRRSFRRCRQTLWEGGRAGRARGLRTGPSTCRRPIARLPRISRGAGWGALLDLHRRGRRRQLFPPAGGTSRRGWPVARFTPLLRGGRGDQWAPTRWRTAPLPRHPAGNLRFHAAAPGQSGPEAGRRRVARKESGTPPRYRHALGPAGG